MTESLIADASYNHENPSRFTRAECESVVGRKATITLTGYIVSAEESDTGPFVRFQPDGRFGFGDFRFGIDLDAITVVASPGVEDHRDRHDPLPQGVSGESHASR